MMPDSDHVIHELAKCEKIIERLYRDQFEDELPHAVKSRLYHLDYEIKDLKKVTGFIFASEGVIK
jgi:hypothetical protein